MKIFFYLIFVLCFIRCFTRIPYKNYRIYDIQLFSKNQEQQLLQLSEDHREYDFLILSAVVNTTSRVIVPPHNVTAFESFLREHSFQYDVINYDLSKTIRLQTQPEFRSCVLGNCVPNGNRRNLLTFDRFYRHNRINKYLDSLAVQYPSIVKVEKIGTSYENKDLKVIKITSLENQNVINKKVIFIEAGIHAREWISPATALYVIHQLVEQYENNKHLISNYEWIILPVANPDGYEYSHSRDRNWRKTRKPNSKRECPGTDANRNFDYMWNKEKILDECHDTYRGPKAFSEPETEAIRNYMERLGPTCKFYLSLHAYGRLFLLPWNAEFAIPLHSYTAMENVALAGHRALTNYKNGINYRIGNSMRVLKNKPVTGTSTDYMHGVLKIPITITMELPGGKSGFDPVKSEIAGFAEEAWIGIKAMAKAVQLHFP